MTRPIEISEIRDEIRKLISEAMKQDTDRAKARRDALVDYALASIAFLVALAMLIKLLFGPC